MFENIAFPLRLPGKHSDEEIRKLVTDAADTLELQEHLDRKPSQLSGGQRQRVAMGRAIVRQADAFLFDEPLSNLDAKLRGQMRTEILRLQRRLGVTTVYVTHDQTEAMTLGDRVAVLKKGVLQQVASPRELYEQPVNLFVAGFIGSPPMNFVPAALRDGQPRAAVRVHPDAPGVDQGGRRTAKVFIAGIRPGSFEDASSRRSRTRPTAESLSTSPSTSPSGWATSSTRSCRIEAPADITAQLARAGQRTGQRADAHPALRVELDPMSRVRAGDTATLWLDTVANPPVRSADAVTT